MKKLFKIILRIYLKIITKIVLFIHKPVVIVVAGSTNKVFVKKTIKKSLRDLGLSVRSNPRNFNTDIGIPLSILELKSGYNEYKQWIPIMYKAFLSIFKKNFPKYLILNYTTSDIGDMKYLISIAKPKITVITEITQKYIEGFNNMTELINEYGDLCAKTNENGVVILNCDNEKIKKLSIRTKSKVIFFGKNKDADFRILEIKRTDSGEYFKVKYNKSIKEYNIHRFGTHYVYATLISEIIRIWCSSNSNNYDKYF